MKCTKDKVLKYLRNWHTVGELRSKFGIKNPMEYLKGLMQDGYVIECKAMQIGVLSAACYQWTGKKEDCHVRGN